MTDPAFLAEAKTMKRVMAMGTEINPIPEEVIRTANRQSAERYRDKPYGRLDWQMLRRRLERTDPSFSA